MRNVTRYTYESTAFQGWRLSLQRRGNHFVRYFSDKEYGGEEASYNAVLEMRNAIYEELKNNPNDPASVFSKFAKKK